MYKNILIPVELDYAHDIGKVLDIVRRLGDNDASVTALYVQEELPAYVSQYIPDDHALNRQSEAETALKAQVEGHSDIRSVVIRGHAGGSIVEYTAENNVDCIVIASHRPGLKDFFLGSTANRVVRHAICAVHVFRE